MNDEYDMDENKLYEELYNLMGAKIRFKCDGCVQEGEIMTIKPRAKRVTLNNVYFMHEGKKIFSGTLKYRFSDLVNYEVVATAKELNPHPRFEYLENILKDKDVSKKYNINDLFFDGCLSEESDEEEGKVKDIEEKEFQLEVPHHLEVPLDSVIVDCYDFEWMQAVDYISKQKVIGVSLHGDKVSRLGKLSWLCISAPYCVFLFDIEKLGVDAFKNGLKSILEDKSVTKVIHDSRFPSDCLANLFDTKLENVFDTQVADFVVSMQCYRDKYKYEYVQCLNSCLRIHLEIPPEFTYTRDRCIDKNESGYFSKRPLKNALRYVLIKDTVYLLLLHKTLVEKLKGPLHRNVERYLKVIAGATKQELDTVGDEISSPDCIPPSLLMYGIQTVQFQKLEEEKKQVSLKCKFEDPITRKFIDVKEYLPVHDDSNSSNCKENISYQKKSSKDDCNDVEGGRQQKLPILKNRERCVRKSYQPEKKSVIVDKITVRPSARRVDEVYHKLVNNSHFRSQNAENMINVKPTETYVSKFTMRIPLECAAFTNSTSSDSATVQETDLSINCESSSVIASDTATNFQDYSDTWAKLREAFSESCNVSHNVNSKLSSVKLVPAGMPC